MKKTKEDVTASQIREVTIKPPKFDFLTFEIVGVAPYVQLRFTEKAKNIMRGNMVEGGNKRGKKKDARDFDSEFPQAMYQSSQGWRGIPAASFRTAMIRACSIVNFKMVLAKMSVFVEADGFDKTDGTPLVRIFGEPEPYETVMRNANGGADIRVRAMWREWSAKVRVRYDADQFNAQDVTNLMARVGLQVGIGEGRPMSRDSAGVGFGIFVIKEK